MASPRWQAMLTMCEIAVPDLSDIAAMQSVPRNASEAPLVLAVDRYRSDSI